MLGKFLRVLTVAAMMALMVPASMAAEVDSTTEAASTLEAFSAPISGDGVSDGFAAVDAVEPAPQPEPDPWVENAEPVIETEVTSEAADTATAAEDITFEEFRINPTDQWLLTQEWLEELANGYPEHTWAPMEFYPTDRQLDIMGLPSSDILLANDYPEPTMISKTGEKTIVDIDPVSSETGTLGPTAPPFAGAGWFGIRPGAKVLLLNGGSIGWCTLAHVYGSPGSYSISTAGHCGKTGDTATLVAAFGNRAGVLNPVLLDFGTFKTSHDGGLGNDWALISIKPEFQNLVTPTMAAWGGPRGMFTKTGAVAGIQFPRRGLTPSVSVNPDPMLAQTIVHYGHGTGIGAGGTARAGLALAWLPTHFMFEGAITWGDSGSGSNAIVGDTVGGSMEAAGINTHLWIDPLMRDGIGIMGGTRATQVSGTLANGQLVAYPVPVAPAP